LMKEGYEVYVLTHTNSFAAQVEKTGIKVINIGSGNLHPVKVSKYIYNLFTSLKRIKPDVVLTFSIRPAICGNFITRYLKIPTITNLTGVGPLFSRQTISNKAALSIYPLALKKTAKVFFENGDDMDLFIQNKFVSPERAERIPGSGVYFKKFSPIVVNK